MGSNHHLVLFTHALCRVELPSLTIARPQSATVDDPTLRADRSNAV